MCKQICGQQNKQKLIIYATCQGEYLTNVLNCSQPLKEQFEVVSYRNFTEPGKFNQNPFDLNILKDCKVFIYHKARAPENLALINKMLPLLSPETIAITIPYVTSNLYWPMHNTAVTPVGVSEAPHLSAFPYQSLILNLLCEKPFPIDEVVNLYTLLNPEQFIDLDTLRKTTYNHWQSLDNESNNGVLVSEFLQQNWQKQLLFYLYNHPAKPVFLHMANQVLAKLHLPALTHEDIRRADCGQNGMYPIHPKVAHYYGLDFIKEASRFTCGKKIHTFKSFITSYVEAYRKDKIHLASQTSINPMDT